MNGDSNGNQEAVFPTSAADGIALPPRTECQRLKVFIAVIFYVVRTRGTFAVTRQSATQICIIV